MESIVLDGLTAKTEPSRGTDALPVVGTDGVRLAEHIWSQITLDFAFPNDRDDHASGSIIPLKGGRPEGPIVELEIRVPAIGAGARYDGATVWPESRPLLLATPVLESFDPTVDDEKVSYAHADTAHGSCTIYAYGGGMVFKVVGCQGVLEWSLEAGMLGVLTFRMQGILTEISQLALPAITYSTVEPPTIAGVNLILIPTIPWLPDFLSASFGQGAVVNRLDSGNASRAVEGFHVPRVVPTFQLNARTVPLATFDPYALAQSRDNVEIEWTAGTASYERVGMDIDEAYVSGQPRQVVDQDFTGWEIPMRVNQYSLVFS